MEHRICAVCARLFEPHKLQTARQLYCGAKCREQAKQQRRPQVPCETCGTLFPAARGTDRANRFCSRVCTVYGRPAQQPEPPSSPIRYGECVECGRTMVTRHGRKLCSMECQKARVRAQQRLRLRVNATPRESRAHIPEPRVCPCGNPYMSRAVNQVYCTRACRRRVEKDRRRAVKVAAYVEDVWRSRIFERDGWRCQLCGKKVARTRVVPHPRAPVLDHIVPLACGGTHEPRNVQLACFLCNSVKSHHAANDQLRLVG